MDTPDWGLQPIITADIQLSVETDVRYVAHCTNMNDFTVYIMVEIFGVVWIGIAISDACAKAAFF